MSVVVFLSDACLLDPRSGAAHSMRARLQALARAGHTCHALTMNQCDGDTECALADVDPALEPAGQGGRWVDVADGPVQHRIYLSHSTRARARRPWEQQAFFDGAREALAQWQPDLVFTFGNEPLRPLLAQAQRQGAQVAFYVATAAYTQREGFDFLGADHLLMPSQALADLYRNATGLKASAVDTAVCGNLVDAPFDGRRNLMPERVATRKTRWVTFINPEPAKGGLFFINVARQVQALAPDVRFRVVEGRWGRADWARGGIDLDALTHVEWVPGTRDMARIYDEAALLLLPSLGFEAASRVAAEALLAGVPVLAMRRGGLPEQLNKGGFLFDAPPALVADPMAPPALDDLRPWAQYIRVLMNDDGLYRQAVGLALQASAVHQRAPVEAALVQTVNQWLARPLLPQGARAADDDRLATALAAQRERQREALRLANEDPLLWSTAHAGGQGQPDPDDPYVQIVAQSLAQPALKDALAAANQGDLERARTLLLAYLRLMPGDLAALSMMATVAERQEREAEARTLLEQVVALAPGFMPGQQQLLNHLRSAADARAALVHSQALLARLPDHPRLQALNAGLLVRANRFEEGMALFETCLARLPGTAQDWMQYALALKTVGQQEPAVAAYRKAIARAPAHGAAWHALSNTKLAVFTEEDIHTMQAQLAREALRDDDRMNMHFTLGKAHEDRSEWKDSFEHYAQANAIRRRQSDYDIGRLEDYVAQAKEAFTAEFFAARQGWGDPAQDPVFVLGLHRAGSTLTEQILASHSQVEGTRELPHMLRIGNAFGGESRHVQEDAAAKDDHRQRLNAGMLRDLTAPECAARGRSYLVAARADRLTPRPLFVDKMPANWMYTGLIHLLLPNAKIIDIRREPMAAGFALFKMNFGKGVDHSYDQQDIARYYRAYADLMAHFDTVLPGRVHHMRYEALVADTEAEIRRLIDYCGLPFEDGCLRYWETERAVQTPSSEQVRRPIYSSAVEQWRHYEPWLGPMKAAFGPLVAQA